MLKPRSGQHGAQPQTQELMTLEWTCQAGGLSTLGATKGLSLQHTSLKAPGE